jgi:hypothetical protein
MRLFLVLCLYLVTFQLFAQEEQETEALKAMRLSCQKHKVGLGCYNYANMLIRADKADQAETIFELGCKLDHSPSCQKEKWSLPEVVKKDLPLPSPASKKEDESLESENTQEEAVASKVFVPSKLSIISDQSSSSKASLPQTQPVDAASEDPINKSAEDSLLAEEDLSAQKEASSGEPVSESDAETQSSVEESQASESNSMAPPPI